MYYTLFHEFAKLEYKKEAYVVCRKNNLARQLFSQDFNVDRILRGLPILINLLMMNTLYLEIIVIIVRIAVLPVLEWLNVRML